MGAENHTGMTLERKARRIDEGVQAKGPRLHFATVFKAKMEVTELLLWIVLQACEARLQVPRLVKTKLSHL